MMTETPTNITTTPKEPTNPEAIASTSIQTSMITLVSQDTNSPSLHSSMEATDSTFLDTVMILTITTEMITTTEGITITIKKRSTAQVNDLISKIVSDITREESHQLMMIKSALKIPTIKIEGDVIVIFTETKMTRVSMRTGQSSTDMLRSRSLLLPCLRSKLTLKMVTDFNINKTLIPKLATVT